MISEYFEPALREWWHKTWGPLIDYQRRFVENGYRADKSFPMDYFKSYEWAVVLRLIQKDPMLRQKLQDGLRTVLGSVSPSSVEAVGRAFVETAAARIHRCELLVGSPDDLFNEVYAGIRAFLETENVLPYEGLTILHGVRVEGEVALDDRTRLRQLGGDERKHVRWQAVEWDDPWDCPAVLSRTYNAPLLKDNEHADSGPVYEDFRRAAFDTLSAIAVVGPQRGTAGWLSISNLGWSPGAVYMAQQWDYPLRKERTIIRQADAMLLQQAWRGVREDRRVNIAAGYLADARRFGDPEKGLIDVVTALEAIAGEDSKQRLPRRTCIYAARIVAQDIDLRQRAVYDTLMQAFERREQALRGRAASAEEKEKDALTLAIAERVVRRFLQLRVCQSPRLDKAVTAVLLEDPDHA